MNEKRDYTAYDYKEISAEKNMIPMLRDCYECFGWEFDNDFSQFRETGKVLLRFRRDRKILNKAELTRLERNFEDCLEEIAVMEQSVTREPRIAALTVGVLGTAFMAGSTFSVTASPPIIWLCVLLAVPGFIGWILPYFLYKKLVVKRRKKVAPLIEAKKGEIYTVCEKGHKLL